MLDKIILFFLSKVKLVVCIAAAENMMLSPKVAFLNGISFSSSGYLVIRRL